MPFTFANAFNRFFKLLGGNFVPFLIVGGIGVVAPAVALNYGMYGWLGPSQAIWSEKFQSVTPENWAIAGGGALVMWLLNLMTLSAITEVAILRSVDKPLNYGAILGHALINALPLFIVSLFTSLLVVLGFILLIVPGIIWALCTCVATPAYVGQTHIGIFGAIGKSFQLTRGHRWPLLLLFVVLVIGELVVSGTMSSMSFSLPGGMLGLPAHVLQAFVSGICSVIGHVFVASLYVSLRESQEKMSPDVAASVFD